MEIEELLRQYIILKTRKVGDVSKSEAEHLTASLTKTLGSSVLTIIGDPR